MDDKEKRREVGARTRMMTWNKTDVVEMTFGFEHHLGNTLPLPLVDIKTDRPDAAAIDTCSAV